MLTKVQVHRKQYWADCLSVARTAGADKTLRSVCPVDGFLAVALVLWHRSAAESDLLNQARWSRGRSEAYRKADGGYLGEAVVAAIAKAVAGATSDGMALELLVDPSATETGLCVTLAVDAGAALGIVRYLGEGDWAVLAVLEADLVACDRAGHTGSSLGEVWRAFATPRDGHHSNYYLRSE